MEAHLIKIDEDYGAVLSHSTSREVRCLRSFIVLSQVGVKRPTEIQWLAADHPANIGQNGTFCLIIDLQYEQDELQGV